MWHRVAALVGCTVEELQQRMTSAEFVRWCAYYVLEPWGYQADNWRMGVVAATVANYSGRVKKAVKPSDFMPSRRKVRRVSAEEVRAQIESGCAQIEKAKTSDDP